jgi:hypothetical protein
MGQRHDKHTQMVTMCSSGTKKEPFHSPDSDSCELLSAVTAKMSVRAARYDCALADAATLLFTSLVSRRSPPVICFG